MAISSVFVRHNCVGVVTATPARTWAVRWVLMLVLVYAASAVVTLRPIVDPDIWWHLRTGEWILEHRTVPATDPFSAFGADRPWTAYSWLFGLGMYGLWQLLGHIGIVLYPLLGGLAITTAMLVLVLRFEFNVPRAIALTALGIAAITPVLMPPRSYLFTIVFFIVEIYVLLVARETGRISLLWALPALFMLWANLHIQFIYGLAVLGMAVAEAVIARLGRDGGGPFRVRRSIPLPPLLLASAACTAATLVSPYGVYIYRPVIEIGSHGLVYSLVIEFGALTFRQPAHWMFLLVALAGVYSLGRQRELQLFPALLIAAGAYLSFATRRDVWFLVIVSLAIIAITWGDRRVPRPTLRWAPAIAGTVLLCTIVTAVAMWRNLSATSLEASLAAEYPVAAVAAVKHHRYPGPLYNTFDWGGFLIWQLPEHRVSMDGRTNIHGDHRIWRSFVTSMGQKGWDTDEELHSARLVILPAGLALAELLRREPDYELVYEDAVAVVFTRREHRDAVDGRRSGNGAARE